MKIPANRIAVYITGLSALAAALAPAVANLDLESTSSVIAGLASLTAVVNVWLRGWQNDEARQGAVTTKAGAVEGSS